MIYATNPLMYCSQMDLSRRSDGTDRAAKYRIQCEPIIFDDKKQSGSLPAILDADLDHVFFYM